MPEVASRIAASGSNADSPPDVRRPSAAILVCTKDRPRELAAALASLRRACSGADIVVVEEADAPRELPGVRYVHLPRRDLGFGHARNVAVGSTDAEIVLFVDDDCVVAEGWAEALLEPFVKDPKILGVAGAVLVQDCGLVGYAENILGFPGGGLRYLDQAGGAVVPTRHLSTCNCAYRRSAILAAGGFPERARLGGEDAVLAERVSACGPCVYTPHARVYHRPRDGYRAVFRWFVRRGQSELVVLGEGRRGPAGVAGLVRSSWTVRGAVLVGVVLLWPQALGLLPPALTAYYLAILWRYRFARRHPTHRRAWWIVPLVKVTMDLGTEVGRWRALFGGTR